MLSEPVLHSHVYLLEQFTFHSLTIIYYTIIATFSLFWPSILVFLVFIKPILYVSLLWTFRLHSLLTLCWQIQILLFLSNPGHSFLRIGNLHSHISSSYLTYSPQLILLHVLCYFTLYISLHKESVHSGSLLWTVCFLISSFINLHSVVSWCSLNQFSTHMSTC